MSARKVPTQELIEDLRRVYREHGTTSAHLYQRPGVARHAPATIYKRFGTWWHFVEAAGLPHAPRWRNGARAARARSTYTYEYNQGGLLARELAAEQARHADWCWCLKCERRFWSEDKRRIRICGACKKGHDWSELPNSFQGPALGGVVHNMKIASRARK